MKKLLISFLAMSAIALGGCAATGVAISKHDLDVQTKMTQSIFLDPPKPGHRHILAQVRNTTDKGDFNCESQLRTALQQRGWTLTNDPDKADYLLQVNILSAGNMGKTAAQSMYGSGYTGALGAGALGAAGSYALHGPGYSRTGVAAGLLAAGAEFVTGQMVKDVYYSVVTDVQISKRIDGKVKLTGVQNLAQGTSGTEKMEYSEETNWKRYRTQVVSTANQVNLAWEDAQPKLMAGLAQSIAGLF